MIMSDKDWGGCPSHSLSWHKGCFSRGQRWSILTIENRCRVENGNLFSAYFSYWNHFCSR
jgi:hypothetical protein